MSRRRVLGYLRGCGPNADNVVDVEFGRGGRALDPIDDRARLIAGFDQARAAWDRTPQAPVASTGGGVVGPDGTVCRNRFDWEMSDIRANGLTDSERAFCARLGIPEE